MAGAADYGGNRFQSLPPGLGDPAPVHIFIAIFAEL
jgi:hypothetical protein